MMKTLYVVMCGDADSHWPTGNISPNTFDDEPTASEWTRKLNAAGEGRLSYFVDVLSYKPEESNA
jgi:hypothetical protein